MPNKEFRNPFRLKWVAGESDAGKLLREFLSKQHISKRTLTAIKFDGGKLIVNDREVTVRYMLQNGDKIEVIFPPEETSEGLIAENIPIQIKYEDEFVLVAVKPAYMNTIPSREHPTGSLANALAGYYRKKGLASTIHIVTRLDRDTSGLVLIAKHRHVHHLLGEQQQQGLVKRKYLAVVEGIIKEEKGNIEEPIGRKPTSIIEREVRADGQYACTLFEVMARLSGYTYIGLQLLTGRTHQIRVHLSHYGFPLAGDDLYGGHRNDISRQALHCCSVMFFHPLIKKTLTFEEPLPADMLRLINQSR
ncbi:RluA family pseudouridine synthase [Peribacillus cavernae]|uniref:Pseudouridine synthase n=1 Tax=Peribacillus cavernae TaxID=1674310 RepID=A0A433HP06_9BACI|nr:RluA family pseudouridine synthase [Peribacillus cavernae]MDQ0217506.1 23S rRNA pseudouridine1911/1915/1917 synthase [Peribacillus cavernae]RUQ30054.1 RluA family pseudouridine synthase [Peribacillus cavernae]